MKQIKPILAVMLAFLLSVLTPAIAYADADTQDALDILTDQSVFQEVSDLLYEMTGIRVNDKSEMADLLETYDLHDVSSELYLFLGETSQMSDEELKEMLNTLADDYGLSLGDRVMSIVIKYMRSMEGLSETELENKLDDLRDDAVSILRATGHVESFGESVGNFFEGVGNFFRGIFG